MNYLMSIMYDGSKFYGFQRQKDKDTVQGKIEEALRIISKSNVEIKGAGRTDRGVHALDQKASFKLDINIDVDKLKFVINSIVKPYIYIKDIQVVPDDFHARFRVLEKVYIYRINMGDINPLKHDYELQINRNISVDKLRECGNIFIGVHNFKNFVAGFRDNYDCIIKDISFKITGDILEITFIGKSFYRYMVRNLVGAMLDYEKGKVSLESIKEALDKPNIKRQFRTEIANGLYLAKISY